MVRPTKDLLGALQGLLKPHSGLQFTQTCQGNSQANSGPAHADQGPSKQHGTLPGLTNKMPSWAKRGLLRPKESPLRVVQETFGTT